MNRWKLLSQEQAFETPWLTIDRKTYSLNDAALTHDYYVVARKPFVLVVAIEDQELVLVQHYRHGTDRTYLELPAGYIESDETPVEAARRELREETGLVAARGELIGELHPLPGYIRSRASIVLCGGLSESGSSIDADEVERVMRVTIQEAVSMILAGQICEMQAVSAILLAKTRADRLNEHGGKTRY